MEKSLRKSQCLLKKAPGNLSLFEDRLEFVAEDGVVLAKIPISDIKSQFVNPATSAKALLRIVTLSNEDQPFQFQFMAASGPHAERDSFKDALAVLINAHRTGSEPLLDSLMDHSSTPGHHPPPPMEEIKARQALLQKYPAIARLHRDLVRGRQLTEEDFWLTRRDLLDVQISENSQNVGLSTEIVHDVRPTSTQGTDIKYTLTPQDIKSIFLHYPSLNKAFVENVPSTMTEKEFWTRCFQSSFFYRDRSQKSKKDDIFDKAAQEEEKALKDVSVSGVRNFLLDLASTDRMDEYQPELDSTMKPAHAKESLPLIRRFNRHSDIVVKSMQNENKISGETPRHKQVLRDVMNMEDLEPPVEQTPLTLNLSGSSAFAPPPNSVTQNKTKPKEWINACEAIANSYNYDEDYRPNPKKTAETLHSIAEMETRAEINPSSILPADTLQEMIILNSNATEILRHFWMCIPPQKEGESRSKFKRMSKAVRSITAKINGVKVQDEPQILKSTIAALEKAEELCAKYAHYIA